MDLAYPFQVTHTGRTDQQARDHVRDLMEQVLFTNPGERVNRPDFGTGLLEFVFGTESDEVIAALQFMIQGALQQWLGEVIDVEGVVVDRQETILQVTVQYIERRTQQRRQAQFKRE